MIPPRRCRRPLAATLAALLLMSAVGCARSGQLLALNPRRSSIREQLSRLEFQNQQLRDELKVARDETQKLAGDLRLAEIDRQDLQRKVDSYRTQLGRAGQGAGDPYELARPAPDQEGPEARSTRPASRPPSAAPFTRIPNPSTIDVTPPPGPSAEGSFGFGSPRSPSYEDRTRPYIEPPPVRYFDLSPSASRADVGLSSRAGGSNWSPLARGSGSSALD
ncbi:hypothetical protein [Tautonia plasticadhaerens]|uniref:IncA protein n=1 Tax=Tautonia plasticadhaerens TaxID=2527974 RepID=A0A518GZ66_9BACT|nr:hypothetical protein [Tautonia plasticadhaerens]QDV33896.1 hypothetical protein ElP_17760 [Tautonia plasticadhaerens]